MIRLPTAAAALLLAANALAQAQPPASLEWDPAIRRGTLPNGLSWFVVRHPDPPGRFSARLVLRVGSMAEQEHERGLMHLLEHLGFEGTARFPGNEMFRRLEAAGMRAGVHVNGSTSRESIDYRLELPSGELPLALDVLEDWAGGALLTDEAIEGERGVVLAELRLRASPAHRRMTFATDAVLAGLAAADRDPRGLESVIATATHESIRALYRRWWRPDLMGIVVAGDVDAGQVVAAIAERFGDMPMPPEPAPLPPAPAEPEPATVARVLQDEELASTEVIVSFVGAEVPASDPGPWLEATVRRRAAIGVLNARLSSLSRMGSLPVIHAMATSLGGGPGLRGIALRATVRDGAAASAVRALVAEAGRLRRDGPLPDELRSVLDGHRGAIADRMSSRSSGDLAAELTSAFLDGRVVGTAEATRRAVLGEIDEIDAGILRAETEAMLAAPRRVVVVTGPGELPSEAMLRAALEAPPTELPSAEGGPSRVSRLVTDPPPPGRVVSRRDVPQSQARELVLSNGVRILVLPHSGKPGEVRVEGWLPHDMLARPRSEIAALWTAARLAGKTGIEGVPPLAMEQWSEGSQARLSFSLEPFALQVRGTSGTDVAPIFERFHALATRAVFDDTGFAGLRDGLAAAMKDELRSPTSALLVDVEALLLDGANPRPWPDELVALAAPTVQAAWGAVARRAADWSFVVVGSVDADAVARAAAQWLATLPGDRSVPDPPRFPEVPLPAPGHHVTTVPSLSPGSWMMAGALLRRDAGAPDDAGLHAAKDVLGLRLRGRLRDEAGESYAVNVGRAELGPHPGVGAIVVLTDVPTGRRGESSRAVLEELARLATLGPSPLETDLVRAQLLIRHEDESRDNEALAARIAFALQRGEPMPRSERIAQDLRALTPDRIRRAARRHLDLSRTFEASTVPAAPDTPGASRGAETTPP